ncbi:MAG: SH3 domain-containing protein, partial [Bacillota bacterium]|nr:SH3 domain-containing protein [Bacillota bacterium]
MKSLKTLAGKSSLLKNLVAAVIVMTVFWMTAFNSLAAEGEVIADTAKIRAQANTSSEVIASTVKGKTIDIVGVEQDSSGMKWYKVPVAGGGYGYIRSDLVKTAETLEFYEGDETSQTVSPTTTEAQKPADTVPTSIGEQQAVIKCDTNVKIRSGASTSHDVVTSLPDGTAITLIGEANDSAGNKWYQMTCSYNGRSIEGYVRSDLIAIGAVSEDNPDSGEGDNPEGGEETPEGENPEGTESEAPEEEEPAAEPEEEHNDYEIRWAQNKDNEDYDYFLYDNVAGNRMRLSEVMNAVNASDENVQKLQDQVDKEKIIIIVLAAVIVLLFIVVTILLFKIRSLYYEDYDEEDEEEEEE